MRIVEEVSAELQMSVREVCAGLADLLGINESTLRGWANRHRSTRAGGRGWRLTSPTTPAPRLVGDRPGSRDQGQEPDLTTAARTEEPTAGDREELRDSGPPVPDDVPGLDDVPGADGAERDQLDGADAEPARDTAGVPAARAEVAWAAAACPDQTSR